jgi:hypothetical protein
MPAQQTNVATWAPTQACFHVSKKKQKIVEKKLSSCFHVSKKQK